MEINEDCIMKNDEYINEILDILTGENNVFDGNIYSFSYFPKRIDSDADQIKLRPTYTLTGYETIKRYNDLFEGLYNNIVGNKKMTLKVFKDNVQNFIFENRFNEEEIKKFVNEKKEYVTNDIYKIYGLSMEKEVLKVGKYTLVKKNYISIYLKRITSLKDTDYNKFEEKLLSNDSNDNRWNFIYIISQHKTIDNLYSTQLMKEEIKKIVYTLRFISCYKMKRTYIDSVPFISYSKSHFQFVNDWMTSGHEIVRKDLPIPIDDEWFYLEEKGHKKLWNLLDFESAHTEIEDRIMKSIEWVGKAYGEEDERVAFLEIAFAFETLLVYDKKGSIKPSIVASLSEAYAFINGRNMDERILLEDEFKDFYGDRSGLVHGQKNRLDNYKINPYEMITKTIRNLLITKKFSECKNMEELFKLLKKIKYSSIEEY